LATASSRETGKVKFFDSRKGFGFILPDNGSRDVFISLNNLPKGLVTLTPDQRCSYLREEGKKGPNARELTLL
jgi:CspA family cold shock protein